MELHTIDELALRVKGDLLVEDSGGLIGLGVGKVARWVVENGKELLFEALILLWGHGKRGYFILNGFQTLELSVKLHRVRV